MELNTECFISRLRLQTILFQLSYSNLGVTQDWMFMYTDFKFYPKELTSLTFGARILDVKKLEIMDIIRVQYPHCKIFQMSVINGTSQRVEVEG